MTQQNSEDDKIPQYMTDPSPRPSRPSDNKTRVQGDVPAMQPGVVHHGTSDVAVANSVVTNTEDNQAASAAAATRREARRSKRAATREKMGRAPINSPRAATTRNSIDSTNSSSTVLAATRTHRESRQDAAMNDVLEENLEDDEDDDVDDEHPGSFAIPGPAFHRLYAEPGQKPKPSIDEENDNLEWEQTDDADSDNEDMNLPIAFVAELVLEYPAYNQQNMIAEQVIEPKIQEANGQRLVPVKWLIIVGCLIFAAAIAISVSVGVVLGNGGDSSAFLPEAAAQSIPPRGEVVAPTTTVTSTSISEQPTRIAANPTQAPVQPPTPSQTPVATTPAPVQTPDPSQTLDVTTPAPVQTPAPSRPSTVSTNNPFYPDSNDRLQCQCRYYLQEFVVQESPDWTSLNENQLSAFLETISTSVDIFNPYPIRRQRRLLRGGRQSRELLPTAFSFSLDVDSQERFGNPSNGGRFGMQLEYMLEFCNDDPPFLPDYHAAFIEYFSSPNIRNQQAEALQIESLIEVAVPNGIDRVCGPDN